MYNYVASAIVLLDSDVSVGGDLMVLYSGG